MLPEQIDHQPIINLIADKGVNFVSALQEAKISFEGQLSSHSPYRFVENREWGTGYYLLHNLKEAFYSYNEYDQSNETLLDLAEQLVPTSSSVEYQLREKDPYDINITIDIRNEGPWTENYYEEVKSIVDYIDYLFGEYKDLIDFHIKLEGSIISKTFQSSFSSRITQKFCQSYLTVEILPKNDDEFLIVENWGGITKQDLSEDSIESKLVEMIDVVKNLDKSKNVSPGTYPIVLSPDVAYTLAHESIGHAVEADQITSGDSFLTNKMGQKVASTHLTILDDPHVRGAGWAEYDDEGTKTKGTLIVEEGVLVDFLTNRITAQQLEMSTTGNARTTSYLTPPEPRQSNIFIEPRDHSVDEILEFTNNGIYLGPVRFASTSIFTGEVVIACQFAQKIKNGELSDLIRPVTLTGNALEILSKVEIIGSDLKRFPTNCLKASNKVSVGAYSPTIGISSHSII